MKKHDCLWPLLTQPLLFHEFFVSIAWQYLSRCFQKSGYFAPVSDTFFWRKNTFAPPTEKTKLCCSSVGIFTIRVHNFFFTVKVTLNIYLYMYVVNQGFLPCFPTTFSCHHISRYFLFLQHNFRPLTHVSIVWKKKC